jgi:hypothetical protein
MNNVEIERMLVTHFDWMWQLRPPALFETFDVPFTGIVEAAQRTLRQIDKFRALYTQMSDELRTYVLGAAYLIHTKQVESEYIVLTDVDPHQSMIVPILKCCGELAAIGQSTTREQALPLFLELSLRTHAIHVGMHYAYGDAYLDSDDPLNCSHVENHMLQACAGSVLFRPFLDHKRDELLVARELFRKAERERYERERRDFEQGLGKGPSASG